MNLKSAILFLCLVLCNLNGIVNAKVLLQAFWWDYWNDNYPAKWADYLTELAPRLKELNIDAVWIPPSVKNSGSNYVGYSPFDHYDLGDKYQKGETRTRLGNKDELLRMVAVMHANGIDVIQDTVLNHLYAAGAVGGEGGKDPAAWNDKFTNFRYVSYASPATNETSENYLSRSGRFPKNWQNFHNNAGHDCKYGDICVDYWGPDICYYPGAYGQSSNAAYNPAQTSGYMRNETRRWMIWYKKQVGFDGFRLDGAKYVLSAAMEDFLYNSQFNAGWASGGQEMFAVGELAGPANELDNWCNSVLNRAGTFDYSLRGALYGVVLNNGAFDLSDIPGSQQGNRMRTVPFVNSHHTFRPVLAANGNYIGWNSASELGGGHIDPFNGRLSAAYAIAFAVDGTPSVFMEDLFNLGGTGKRYTHDPKDPVTLPVRDDLLNIIWCHQHLQFKAGAYKVPYQSADLLVIERSAKAIIGVTDSLLVWHTQTITTDFPVGTILKDYSGATGETTTVQIGRQVTIKVPPCNGSANDGRRCYAIWGPLTPPGYSQAPRETTQEWEMANDLGDSHPLSLKQGGQLPDNSIETRTVGRIFVEAASPVTYNVYPTKGNYSVTLEFYDNNGTLIHTDSASALISGRFTPTLTGWLTVKVRNSAATSPGQVVYVVLTYRAPSVVDTKLYN